MISKAQQEIEKREQSATEWELRCQKQDVALHNGEMEWYYQVMFEIVDIDQYVEDNYREQLLAWNRVLRNYYKKRKQITSWMRFVGMTDIDSRKHRIILEKKMQRSKGNETLEQKNLNIKEIEEEWHSGMDNRMKEARMQLEHLEQGE